MTPGATVEPQTNTKAAKVATKIDQVLATGPQPRLFEDKQSEIVNLIKNLFPNDPDPQKAIANAIQSGSIQMFVSSNGDIHLVSPTFNLRATKGRQGYDINYSLENSGKDVVQQNNLFDVDPKRINPLLTVIEQNVDAYGKLIKSASDITASVKNNAQLSQLFKKLANYGLIDYIPANQYVHEIQAQRFRAIIEAGNFTVKTFRQGNSQWLTIEATADRQVETPKGNFPPVERFDLRINPNGSIELPNYDSGSFAGQCPQPNSQQSDALRNLLSSSNYDGLRLPSR